MEHRRLTLVVAFDFTDLGRRTLLEALKVTRGQRDTQLHVVHVATPDEVEAQSGETALERRNQALGELRRRTWAEVYRLVGPALRTTPTSVEVCLGEPQEELLRVASAVGADWVVVGDTLPATFPGLRRTSLSQRLVDTAPCPVLRVRQNELGRIEPADRIQPAPSNPRVSRTRSRSLPHYESRDRSIQPDHGMFVTPVPA